MIYYKNNLNKKDRNLLVAKFLELPYSKDFYLTDNLKRIFIQNNPYPLFHRLKNGDIITFDDKYENIIIVTGIADRKKLEEKGLEPRKYLKALYKDITQVEKCLQILFWNFKDELYAKFKKDSSILKLLMNKYRFYFFGGRGEEILIKRSKANDRK